MKRVSRQRIHIAPVGFEIDRVVLPAVMDKADKVYLMIHDNPSEDKATKYAAEIEKRLKAAKIKTEFISCDWRNIEEITRTTRDLILKESDNEIAINLASGSKNHAIALDRACMTFRDRRKIIPFYPEAKKWSAHTNVKNLTQLTTGVKAVKQIHTHRIIVPEPALVETLKIIHADSVNIPLSTGRRGITKTDLAKKVFGSAGKQNLTRLQRSITQKLLKPWKAIQVFKVGRKEYISLSDEGDYLRYILENEETSVGQ